MKKNDYQDCTKIIFLLASLTLFSGCATIFSSSTQKVNFRADKTVTIILTDDAGNRKHTIPKTIAVSRSDGDTSYSVVGCPRSYNKIGEKLKATTFLNLIAPPLFIWGMLIDYATGFMFEYEPSVYVETSGC